MAALKTKAGDVRGTPLTLGRLVLPASIPAEAGGGRFFSATNRLRKPSNVVYRFYRQSLRLKSKKIRKPPISYQFSDICWQLRVPERRTLPSKRLCPTFKLPKNTF